MNEGGDNNGDQLDFWRSLRPRWTPVESGTVHVFENIHVYVEYSHCQFRVYGLDASLWDVEEFQVLTEVLIVH